MEKLRNYISSELSGWQTWEIVWYALVLLASIIVPVLAGDSWIEGANIVTGVLGVLLMGKGKSSGYLVAIVNVGFMGYIAWQTHYYGSFLLNVVYYLPLHIWGLFAWLRHMNAETCEVHKRRMSGRARLLFTLLIAGGTWGYGLILNHWDSSQPFFDAFITVSSMVGQFLCVKRYMEQWGIWLIADGSAAAMWYVAYLQGGVGVSVPCLWMLLTINCLVLSHKWIREANNNYRCE